MPGKGQTVPVEQRFWAKVEKSETCWEWTGSKGWWGHGTFLPDGRRIGARKNVYAHRFAYELLVGPIPEGMTLDHLCRNPPCVNPDHLEAVPLRENILRGIGPTAVNARKEVCKRGHPLVGPGADVRVTKAGGRQCRACVRQLYREKSNPYAKGERS